MGHKSQWRFCCRAPADVRAAALPADASCEDLEVDPALRFLDTHVASALADGAAPYISEEQRFAMGAVRPSHHEEARPQEVAFTSGCVAALTSAHRPVGEPVLLGTSLL